MVRLAGELDVATAPRAARILRAALTLGDVVIVDLRDLVFIDVAGLHVLLDASARARTDGQRVVVVRGPAPVERVFALTRADQLIEFVDLGPFAPPLPPVAGVATFACSVEGVQARVEARLRTHLEVIAPRLEAVRPAAPGGAEAIA